jgi:hypothetical protein
MSLIFGMLARLSTMARCAFAGDVQNLHRGVILGQVLVVTNGRWQVRHRCR